MEDFVFGDSDEEFSIVTRDVDVYYLDENESIFIERAPDSFTLNNEDFIINLDSPYKIGENCIIQGESLIEIPDLEIFKKIVAGEAL